MTKSEYARLLFRQELARRKFWQFCLYYESEFFESRPFLEEIADAMQDVEEGSMNSLSVSLPPRAGKSYITSLYCAWTLGRNPSESVMRNTCTATLYLKFSYDVRAIIKSDKYQEVFNVALSDDKKNLQGWNTNKAKMVSYFGAGVGGTIIGFGATKVAITDDLYRGLEDALSDTKNDKIIQWKEATHDSRFESGCARIDIGTRWSINDVIGRNIEEGIYDKSIIIPALNNQDESFCESVMTTAEYQDKRMRTAKEIWLAEYQQQPVDIEGKLFSELNMVTEEDFKRAITPDTNNPKHKGRETLLDGCIAYIDVADQGDDYCAVLVAGVVGEDIYCLDYLFTKDNTDVTIPLASAMLNKWNVSYCRVESNSMGAMFSRMLSRETTAKVLQIANSTNKMTRIIMQSAFIMNHFKWVQYPGNIHAIQFLDNMHSFSKEGKNRNDDAPDCSAGLSMFIQSMFKVFRSRERTPRNSRVRK
jgi:predicted phage terminase large subunit-like protein